MIRPSTIFWLMIVAVLGFSLFRVKYEVQALEDSLARIRRDTNLQQEALHVLRAEWTYLNQADRLQVLSAKFLTFSPLTSAQITTVDQLPLRPPGAPPVVQPQPAAPSLVASSTAAPRRLSPTASPAARPAAASPSVPRTSAAGGGTVPHSTPVAFHAAATKPTGSAP